MLTNILLSIIGVVFVSVVYLLIRKRSFYSRIEKGITKNILSYQKDYGVRLASGPLTAKGDRGNPYYGGQIEFTDTKNKGRLAYFRLYENKLPQDLLNSLLSLREDEDFFKQNFTIERPEIRQKRYLILENRITSKVGDKIDIKQDVIFGDLIFISNPIDGVMKMLLRI